MEFAKLTKSNGKAFTGNAYVMIEGNGTISLCSYRTIVAQVVGGKFRKTWNGYSASTARHIQLFALEYAPEWWMGEGRPEKGTWKAHWLAMETEPVK